MSTRTLAAIALLAAGCAPNATDAQEPDDPVAAAACRDYRALIADADLYTEDELRDELSDVHDRARHADNPDVGEAARAMVSAITADDLPAFGDAADRMTAACQEIDNR